MANDQMHAGPHGSPLEETLAPVQLINLGQVLVATASATSVGIAPPDGMEYEIVSVHVTVETTIAATNDDTSIAVGTAGTVADDDGYVTAKVLPTATAAGTGYSTLAGTLAKGALFAAPTAAASRWSKSQRLTLKTIVGTGGAVSGAYRVWVVARPLTGPFPLYNTSI